MKKFKLFSMMAVAAMAVSCSSDDVVQQVQQDNAIQFGTYLGNAAQSRATIADIDALKETGFGVTAYYTGQTAWADYTPGTNGNFMSNQSVTWDDATEWTYTPLKYWPNNPDDKVSFFAYAPYTDENRNVSASAASKDITFTVNEAVLKQTDLLCAAPLLNQTKPSIASKLQFDFKHVLSAIGLQVEALVDEVNTEADGDTDDETAANGTTLDANTNITVNSVKIVGSFYPSGVLNPLTSVWTPAAAAERTYTFDKTADDVELVEAVANNVTTTKQQLSKEDAYLMVIPQENIVLTVTVDYTVTTTDNVNAENTSVVNNVITTTLPAVALEQGYKYDLCLHIGMTSVELDATVSDWATGTFVANVPINK